MNDNLSEMLMASIMTAIQKSKANDLSLIQCSIEKLVDSSTGLYEINYKGNKHITAYSLNSRVEYSAGTVVFVLCSEGNISGTKVILGVSGEAISPEEISMAIDDNHCLNITY